MGVHIRIANIWKTQKTFRPSQFWLHDCKKQMQILLHVAHSQQDEARARQLLRPLAQQAAHNIPWISVSCPCFLQAEKERCWKAVLASFFAMFIFPPKHAKPLILGDLHEGGEDRSLHPISDIAYCNAHPKYATWMKLFPPLVLPPVLPIYTTTSPDCQVLTLLTPKGPELFYCSSKRLFVVSLKLSENWGAG